MLSHAAVRFCLCLCVLSGWNCSRTGAGSSAEKEAAARPVPVVAAAVAQRDVPVYLDGLGTVAAFKTVTVKTLVDGRLEKVLFKEGQEVKQGDVLAQIDPRPFQVQLHQAEGAMARDSAQLRDTRLNFERYTKLVQQKLIPQQQVDDQQALVGQNEGAVRVDQAQIENARLQLDYARITAPLSGVTGVRLLDPGNIVRQNDQTGIVVITQIDPIAVLFTLPQDDLHQVAQQQKQGPLPVEAFGRDGEAKLGTGELLLIDNQINQTTATIRLKAIFPNPERLLWPNQFVKARLLLTVRKGALVVPATVVQRGPKGMFAYVIAPDQTASPRPIELEMTTGEVAVIAKGLSAGEQVVVDGQNQLRPGSKVAPRPPAGAGESKDGGGKAGRTKK